VLGSLAAFERRYNDDPTLQDVVRDIDAVEQKIDNAMKSRQNLQDLITRMVTGNKEVKFTDKSIEVRTSDGKDIGLIALSSGEKHLLRIFVQILLASENTIMIDEPEISMHVDWQKNLLSGMRALNSEAQIILATHSPEIMADVPDDKIFRL
jgi:predicted ATPase